ncbi:MAG TPA: hemerythrin domain-containing protein [Blastocatellia bacterium]|nr:hemerythrin domain-containing protein [Blastocatellia bacterium]
MSDPFHILKQEHRIIERGLRALDGICLRLEWGEELPAETLAELVDFTGNFIDHYHHGKEETYLFPALEREGFQRESGPLGALEHEHEIETELTRALSLSMEAYGRGEAGASRLFIEAARSYINHLIGHMQKEESILFRLAREVIDEPDLDALMIHFNDPGAELKTIDLEKYDLLARELEKKYSV